MRECDLINRWVEKNAEHSICFLQELVRIPSVNPWFSNYDPYTTEKDVQYFIAEKLKTLGMNVNLWDADVQSLAPFKGMPGYYEGRPMHERPNLCGVLPGNGGGRSLLLTGHADVVKAGEGWTREPFGGTLENGRIYGRGSVDMKGGIAAMILAVQAIQDTGIQLRGDVLVGTVADEEAGGMGTLDFVQHGYKADGAIMAEPTGMCMGPMCRGILWGKLVIPARAGHIEMYQGSWKNGGAVDAIRLARLYLEHIDQLNRYWAVSRTHPLLQMPCQLIVSQINAGEYPSAYAGSAEICFNAQYLPDELDSYYRGSKVKKQIEDFFTAIAQTDEWMRQNPPHVEWLLDADCAETDVNGEFMQACKRAVHKFGEDCPVVGIGCHTDMGWYVRSGIPTINFGPGDPKLCHQPDESISVEEYLHCIKLMAGIISEWCA